MFDSLRSSNVFPGWLSPCFKCLTNSMDDEEIIRLKFTVRDNSFFYGDGSTHAHSKLTAISRLG